MAEAGTEYPLGLPGHDLCGLLSFSLLVHVRTGRAEEVLAFTRAQIALGKRVIAAQDWV